MFSDSGAPAPGEQRSFKHHTPHFIPWLRNSLKPHHGSDQGLNGPYKPSSEAPNHLTPLERAKGIGLFSIQGKEKKKGELRLNGVGMARILPVVLRGHHILPGGVGKQKDTRPSRWSRPPELRPDSGDLQQGLSNNSTSAQEQNSSLHPTDGTGTSATKYGPLVGAPPAASPEDPEGKATDAEDGEVRVWDDAGDTTDCRRALHSSSWIASDCRRLTERQGGFTSSFSYLQQRSRKSQSQRDLREPPAEGFHMPLNGVVFSTGVSGRGLSCTATLRGARKPRTDPGYAGTLGPNQTHDHSRPTVVDRKVVRSQIKRVVDNLEQVLRALRDVHQEMKEVVQQIDFLTSSIDLREDEHQSAAGGDGADSLPRPLELGNEPRAADSSGRRADHRRSVSPPNVLLSAVTSGFSPDAVSRLRFAPKVAPLGQVSSLRPSSPPQLEDDADFGPFPQKTLPVRPPTPGLSPLTVNLHHPSSPGSQPHSPGPSTSIRVSPSSPLSPKIKPPPTLCPSVIIENKIRHYQKLQSDHPSVAPPSRIQPPSACCPPTNTETQISASDHREEPSSSAHPVNGLSYRCMGSVTATTAQGRRGRKPPPYPHHRLSEQAKKEEPRKAPPYPEKRRLLSTTV